MVSYIDIPKWFFKVWTLWKGHKNLKRSSTWFDIFSIRQINLEIVSKFVAFSENLNFNCTGTVCGLHLHCAFHRSSLPISYNFASAYLIEFYFVVQSFVCQHFDTNQFLENFIIKIWGFSYFLRIKESIFLSSRFNQSMLGTNENNSLAPKRLKLIN